jgi:hypothetical protein
MYSNSRLIAFALLLACAEHAIGQAAAPARQSPSFTMGIGLSEGTVKRGSDVLVTVNLTNTSATAIQLWRARSGPPPYTIRVCDHEGRATPMTAAGRAFQKGQMSVSEEGKIVRIFSGSGAFVTIAPGGTVEDWVSIEDKVDLSQPGAYTIQLERIDPATKLPVKSNTVSLTVTK